MSVRADAETLRSIPIFADCDPVHLQLLAFSSERRHYKSGDTIVKQGEIGEMAILILDGQAELLHDKGGGFDSLGTAGPGAMIGEIAMIGGVSYSISAIARSAVSATGIRRELFLRLAEEYPEFGATVFKALAQKLDGSMSDLLSIQAAFDRARSFSNL